MLPADARYEVSIGRNGSNKLLSPLAIALAREALERAHAGLDVAGSADGGATRVCFESTRDCDILRTEPRSSSLDEASSSSSSSSRRGPMPAPTRKSLSRLEMEDAPNEGGAAWPSLYPATG